MISCLWALIAWSASDLVAFKRFSSKCNCLFVWDSAPCICPWHCTRAWATSTSRTSRAWCWYSLATRWNPSRWCRSAWWARSFVACSCCPCWSSSSRSKSFSLLIGVNLCWSKGFPPAKGEMSIAWPADCEGASALPTPVNARTTLGELGSSWLITCKPCWLAIWQTRFVLNCPRSQDRRLAGPGPVRTTPGLRVASSLL